MVIYSREKVARLREQYPAGTRICLNSMDGEAGMRRDWKELCSMWMMQASLVLSGTTAEVSH